MILGSKSWSRRTLLQELGVPEFSILVADIDESAITAKTPRDLVLAIGKAKANAIVNSHFQRETWNEGSNVLLVCGDSVVTHKSAILGKPKSKEHARSIMRSYATAPATTVSSIVVVNMNTKMFWAGVDEAEVYFRPLPEKLIDDLIENGDAMESAGGLRVEHPEVTKYIDCIIGEKSALMGFSQPLAEELLLKAISGGEDSQMLSVLDMSSGVEDTKDTVSRSV